jgi:hypothetical protein
VFCILCLLAIAGGGAIPAVLGFVGSSLCITVSKMDMPTPLRVALCSVVTVMTWVLLFVVAIIVAMILY